MAHQLILPSMGEGMVEATIATWLKAEGEPVVPDEPLVEVETDKVTTEIVAEQAGVLLKILAGPGETIQVGEPLGWIGRPGETLDLDLEAARPKAEAGAEPLLAQTVNGNGVAAHPAAPKILTVAKRYTGRVTPVVARMVKEHDLDLDLISGSGKGGRITKRDVDAYLGRSDLATADSSVANSSPPPTVVPSQSPEEERMPTQSIIKIERAAVPTAKNGGTNGSLSALSPADAAGELLPHSGMRRRIAEHMVMSKGTSPHATTVFEVDYEGVKAHRAQEKADFARRGVKLTYTAYIAAAVIKGLIEVPKVNSVWQEDGIFLKHGIHLGIATAVDNGLVVPVIRHAERLNLLGVAQQIGELAEKGRSNRLAPADLQGGTFTITNHGIWGSQFASPIINQPQAGILGVGVIEDRVCAVDREVAIRLRGYLSFAFDHRILDGADADRFMGVVKTTLEANW